MRKPGLCTYTKYTYSYVTGFGKMVPNHTFLFGYIYHCHMDSITYYKIFHNTMWNNSFQKFLKVTKKYSGIPYAFIEILLNTCWNTLNYMCDLELFSQIRSHLYNFSNMWVCMQLTHIKCWSANQYLYHFFKHVSMYAAD